MPPPHPVPSPALYKQFFHPSHAHTPSFSLSRAHPRGLQSPRFRSSQRHGTQFLPADHPRARVLVGLAHAPRSRRGGAAALHGGFRQGDVVPRLRAGEGGDGAEAVLRGGGGDKGERPGVPLLLHRADPQREQPDDQEHEHPGVPPPPAPLRLQPQELQHQRLPQKFHLSTSAELLGIPPSSPDYAIFANASSPNTSSSTATPATAGKGTLPSAQTAGDSSSGTVHRCLSASAIVVGTMLLTSFPRWFEL